MEGRIALEELISRFEGFVAPVGEVEWNQSLTVRGPVQMPVEFFPRA
jgi:hypothetical protein